MITRHLQGRLAQYELVGRHWLGLPVDQDRLERGEARLGASPGGALQSPPRRRAAGPGRVPQRRVIAGSAIRAPTTKMRVAR